MQPDALYAYAVLAESAHAPQDVAAILPDAGFELVHGGGCVALASPVPRAPFQDGPEGRAGDPGWIAERAARHHAVVAACAAAGPTLPMAFGALFSTAAKLEAWLDMRRDALAAGLAQVTGCAEWSARVDEDAEAHLAWLEVHDPELRGMAARIATAPPGIAYLLERRMEQLRRAARAARRSALAERLAAALAEHARALPEELTALIAEPRQAQLSAEIARIGADFAGSGLAPRLAGPWPAYAVARGALGDD
jgi:hypothetical protein